MDLKALSLYQGGAAINHIYDMKPFMEREKVFPRPLSVVVAMRYHACVWASLHHIPFLALVIDDKLKYFAEEMRQEWVDLRLEKCSYLSVVERINRLVDDRILYQDKLKKAVQGQIQLANNHQLVFTK